MASSIAPDSTAQKDYDYKDKLCFLGEWFDYDAAFHKNLLVNYYPADNTVELFDHDLNRIFLRRAACEGVGLDDMFIGNKIRVYGRQIKILKYADCATERIVGKAKEHTFAILKPTAVAKLGEVISLIEDKEFRIINMRMCLMTRKEALDFYEYRKGDAFLPFMIEHIVSGSIVALELVGFDAVKRWQTVMGPRDPAEARRSAPNSIRALYGLEPASNAVHGSENVELFRTEKEVFFPETLSRKPPATTAKIENSTLCVIKPHAVAEGKLGYIISAIVNSPKFKITALQMLHLTTPNADEFLEVYKGVVSDYHALLLTFLDGPAVALEISAKQEGIDVHREFREFAGPSDSDIARQIRPNSLRGMFGVSKYKNAIHCTDLAEDTQLELDYMFKILEDY